MTQIERLDGGGSFAVCPDTGAVTRTAGPDTAPAVAAPAVPADTAAPAADSITVKPKRAKE